MTVIPAPVDQVAAVLADLVAGRAYTGPPCTYRAAAVDWLISNGCINPTTAALTALGRRMHTMLNRTIDPEGPTTMPADRLYLVTSFTADGTPTEHGEHADRSRADRTAYDAVRKGADHAEVTHHDYPVYRITAAEVADRVPGPIVATHPSSTVAAWQTLGPGQQVDLFAGDATVTNTADGVRVAVTHAGVVLLGEPGDPDPLATIAAALAILGTHPTPHVPERGDPNPMHVISRVVGFRNMLAAQRDALEARLNTIVVAAQAVLDDDHPAALAALGRRIEEAKRTLAALPPRVGGERLTWPATIPPAPTDAAAVLAHAIDGRMQGDPMPDPAELLDALTRAGLAVVPAAVLDFSPTGRAPLRPTLHG